MKKQTTISVGLLLLCLFVKPIFAQDSTAVLTGMITDDLDSAASMYDAVIFLKKGNGKVVKTITADYNGTYKMENIRPGRYYLECEANGYHSGKVWRGLRFKEGDIIQQDFALRDKLKKSPKNKWKDLATITPASILLLVGILALL